ncbi:hypothetical protein [Lichenibacterium dinghuense]|uniref:hypothetical protein n=1 Tax=Lichenibacterium dinghuense TaxID=2895977 RepID=UPI001F423ACE|nr:hypothetical protein [Lichenibacterium sp. 6Y81]
MSTSSVSGRRGPAGLIAAAVLLCAAGAGTAAFTLLTVYRLHVPLPYWDEWYTVIPFRRYAEGTYGLADLAAQHNEHRILFPRLFFFADELLFGLSGLLNATVTLLLQAINAALLIAWMARNVRSPLHRALLSGFVVLALFTLRQEQNFTNGFQLQFVGVFTAAALAGSAYAAALDRLGDGRRGSAPFFALAALGCTVAAYTMANGVLAGGVLAAAAVLRRAPWRVPVATAVLAAALGALFFHGYQPGGDSQPLSQALAHPIPYLRYLAAYLGNPLGEQIGADQWLGAAGLLLAAGAAWRTWSGRARDGASLKLLILAGFVLASAGATAYGRIALGTDQATESRYATPALLFWCAIVLFWFPVAFPPAGPVRRRAAAVGLGGIVAVLAAASLFFEATAWPALAERSTALRRMSDSLVSGLYDADAAGTYEITPADEIARDAAFLRQHRLAAFADPDTAALGRPLAVLGRVAAPGGCAGSVSARADAALGAGGVRLQGTARDESTRRAPRRVIVADAAGTVVGFGSASLPSEPSRLWWADARGAAGEDLQVYVRLADGALCRLGAATVQ